MSPKSNALPLTLPRLPPEIYQRAMTQIFGDLPGVEIVMDDILVHGCTREEHDTRLHAVLKRCRGVDLKLNTKKTTIGQTEVDYVGHRITSKGLKPSGKRVKSILEMRNPENLAELETILGMIGYLAKFIPSLSELNAPLRALKTKDWTWGTEEKQAFQRIKDALTSDPVLKFYDVAKPILLSVDASSHGLGAAVIQGNGVVAYASRALTPTEQRYAQIEKEALAVLFGCQRFHQLIYGKTDVTIESDHKPLETLFKKTIHTAPMRIQRMMLRMQPYTFKLVYKQGSDIGLADCLSRLPIQHHQSQDEILDEELMVCSVDTFANSQQAKLAAATTEDAELQAVKQLMATGWPERKYVPLLAAPYWEIRDELSTYDNIVYRGNRICIPRRLRPHMLQTAHASHMGIVKTKQLMRDILYWPGVNKEIEALISKCPSCLEHQAKNTKEPMQPHEVPDLLWNKVGCDLFELHGDNYMVMVDYYSGFIELDQLESTTSRTVIKYMKKHMARYGIVNILMTDNGPQFTSTEFKEFAAAYGFQHVTSSPLRPQSNGLAEQAVRTMKQTLKKAQQAGTDIYLALLNLRNTPRDDVLGSPAQRLMARRTKTALPTDRALLRPKLQSGPNVVSE